MLLARYIFIAQMMAAQIGHRYTLDLPSGAENAELSMDADQMQFVTRQVMDFSRCSHGRQFNPDRHLCYA